MVQPVDMTPGGRVVALTTALLVIGYALGSLTGPLLTQEGSLAILSGAGALLLLAVRRRSRR